METISKLESDSIFLLTLGNILLFGLITATLGRQKYLPSVTLLIIFGLSIGKQGLDIIPVMFSQRFELNTDMALLMIGFLLEGKLIKNSLQHSMSKVLWISQRSLRWFDWNRRYSFPYCWEVCWRSHWQPMQ